MYEELLDYFNKNFKLEAIDLTYGDEIAGSKRLLGALSRFFNDYFHPLVPVTADHMIFGSGLSSV